MRPSRNFPRLNKEDALLEPGMVEVKFRENVRPKVHPGSQKEKPSVESTTGVDLSGFHQVIYKHRCWKAMHTVPVTLEQGDRHKEIAKSKGMELPHMAHFVRLHFPKTAPVKQIADELRRLPEIEYAGPVRKKAPPQAPKDEPITGTVDTVTVDAATQLEHAWYIFRCKADSAWTQASGSGVVIADIDAGFRLTHQDLAPNIDLTHVYNSYDGGADVSHQPPGKDLVSHGTAVLGLAGAASNGKGMAGFAYKSMLWPIDCYWGPGNYQGTSPEGDALFYVMSHTAPGGPTPKVAILEVQTAQYGNFEQDPPTNSSIKTAISQDIVVCMAAGNGTKDVAIDDSGNPIPESGVILVAATAYDKTRNQRADFSNYGSRVTVSAPGDGSHDITCLDTADTAYRNGFGGTSGATPKVAGTAALMLDVNPVLTHAQVRAILNQTGTEIAGMDYAKPIGPFLNANDAVTLSKITAGGRLVANRFLNFGSLKKGEQSPALKVTLINIGAANLNLTSLTQTSGSTDFAVSTPLTTPAPLVASGGEVDFAITFSPTSRGDQRGTFSLVTDDPNSPLEIICTGTTPALLPEWLKWTLIVLGMIAGALLLGYGAAALLSALHLI
jgi:subtilisin family serine protease